jgi:hypothetical protein
MTGAETCATCRRFLDDAVLHDDHEVDLPDILADLEVWEVTADTPPLQQAAAQAGEQLVLPRDPDAVAEEDLDGGLGA